MPKELFDFTLENDAPKKLSVHNQALSSAIGRVPKKSLVTDHHSYKKLSIWSLLTNLMLPAPSNTVNYIEPNPNGHDL